MIVDCLFVGRERLMGKLGHGYGSEFHLLRWMGRHREQFDKSVLAAIGMPATRIDWLDFNFTPVGGDSEWKGIEFLAEKPTLHNEWKLFWPNKRGIHNWDAVGIMQSINGAEWILVEAKAHANEIQSSCQASDRDSLRMIKEAFNKTKEALGVEMGRDWTNGCYQFANRLAVLWFLRKQHVPAHLLFIYFTGDKRPGSKNPAWNPECPIDRYAWEKVLEKQAELLGLPKEHPLAGQIHKLFLPVFGASK